MIINTDLFSSIARFAIYAAVTASSLSRAHSINLHDEILSFICSPVLPNDKFITSKTLFSPTSIAITSFGDILSLCKNLYSLLYGFVSKTKSSGLPDIFPDKIILPFLLFATAAIKSAVAGTDAVDPHTIIQSYSSK